MYTWEHGHCNDAQQCYTAIWQGEAKSYAHVNLPGKGAGIRL